MPREIPEIKEHSDFALQENDLYLKIRDAINNALIKSIKPEDTNALTVANLYNTRKNSLSAILERPEDLEFTQKERLGITYIIKNINICLNNKSTRSVFITNEEKNQLHAFHKRFFSQEPSTTVSMGKSLLPTVFSHTFESKQKQLRLSFIKSILGDQFDEIKKLCEKYQQLMNLSTNTNTMAFTLRR